MSFGDDVKRLEARIAEYERQLEEAQGKAQAVEDYEHWQDSHISADPGYVPACLGPNCPACKQARDALLDRILSKEGE